MRFSATGAAAVLVLLYPMSVVDTNPPICHAMFSYRVPCGAGLALASALGAVLRVAVTAATIRARSRGQRIRRSGSQAGL